MSARDELEALVARRGGHVKATANDILAAGYSKPRTITTAEELDALPNGSVVLSETIAHQKYGEGETYDWAAEGRFYAMSQIDLPATVLYTPKES